MSSTRFDKQNEGAQVLDEIELQINLKLNKNLTDFDIDNIDVKSLLKHQSQNHESKKSGWRFDKIFDWQNISTKLPKWLDQVMWKLRWDLQLY